MAQFEGMKGTHAGPKSLLDVRLVIVAVFLCTWFPHIGSLSLKPPAEEVLNTHLCPDPVLTQSSKLHGIVDPSKVVSVSLQKSAKTKDRASTYFSRFRPCTFYEDAGPLSAALLREDNGNNVTFVRIRSINLNVGPWNFSGSGECNKFIMFKSWAEYGNGYPITCGRDSFDQYLGPYGHPMILYYHLKDQGISFPLFHPNVGQNYRDQKDHPLELKYMLIYYSIRRNGVSTCRLQQYRLHPAHQSCPSTPEPNCGEYSCPELDTLYQKKMGVVRDGEQQRFIIVKSKTQEKYRVRNFLRQKFVPIVFLLVLVFAYKSYMKAGLRLSDPLPLPVSDMRLRRYHQRPGHHHLRPYLSSSREHFRDIYFEYGGEQIPGLHIPYDPNGVNTPTDPNNPEQCPNNNLAKYVARAGLDPPPSYESLFPPTYVEATAPKDPKV